MELGQIIQAPTTDDRKRETEINIIKKELSDTIPNDIGQLINLRAINLSDNQLSGHIPVEIGQLTNLGLINLSKNQLSGHIPVEIGQLTGLRTLNLSENQLSGHIPIEIGQLIGLRTLILSNNQLSGHIPIEIEQLTDLRTLYTIIRTDQLLLSLTKSYLFMSSNLNKNNLSDLRTSYVIGQLSGHILRTRFLSNNKSSKENNKFRLMKRAYKIIDVCDDELKIFDEFDKKLGEFMSKSETSVINDMSTSITSSIRQILKDINELSDSIHNIIRDIRDISEQSSVVSLKIYDILKTLRTYDHLLTHNGILLNMKLLDISTGREEEFVKEKNEIATLHSELNQL